MKLEELQNQIDNLQKEIDKLKENKPVKIDISNWEEKGVVSKSANIIVAPEDYWEVGNDGEFGVVDGKKRYFTWDEAMAVSEKLGDGWRLPTTPEMMHLVAEFGIDETGDDDEEKFMEALGFRMNGFFRESNVLVSGRGHGGRYWSSTASSATTGDYLRFNSGGLYPRNSYYKTLGFSVRLVKDLEEE